MNRDDYQEHRERLRESYLISDAWRNLGFEGEPSKSCRCPWREDRKPSFSVFDEGRSFKDFSADETGDVFTFIMPATGWEFKDVLQWIEVRTGLTRQHRMPMPSIVRRPSPPKPKKKLKLPALYTGTDKELMMLAQGRRVHPYAITIALKISTLRFGEVCGLRCWILLDESRRLAEVLEVMAGHIVRIYPHHDPSRDRLEAAQGWPEQLASEAGFSVGDITKEIKNSIERHPSIGEPPRTYFTGL